VQFGGLAKGVKIGRMSAMTTPFWDRKNSHVCSIGMPVEALNKKVAAHNPFDGFVPHVDNGSCSPDVTPLFVFFPLPEAYERPTTRTPATLLSLLFSKSSMGIQQIMKVSSLV